MNFVGARSSIVFYRKIECKSRKIPTRIRGSFSNAFFFFNFRIEFFKIDINIYFFFYKKNCSIIIFSYLGKLYQIIFRLEIDFQLSLRNTIDFKISVARGRSSFFPPFFLWNAQNGFNSCVDLRDFQFLNTVVRQTQLPVMYYNIRIIQFGPDPTIEIIKKNLSD